MESQQQMDELELLLHKYRQEVQSMVRGELPEELRIDTFCELERTLQSVTFGPSAINYTWRFEIVPSETAIGPGWFVRIAFFRKDAVDGVNREGYGRYEFIQKGATQSAVVKTSFLLHRLIVEHEIMEAFLFRHYRPFNPHHLVKELCLIRGKVIVEKKEEKTAS